MKRRKKGTLDKVVLAAAKDIRKAKLEFERLASTTLSDALGFQVQVKIKKQPIATTGWTPAMKRASRKTQAQAAEELNASFIGGDPLDLG